MDRQTKYLLVGAILTFLILTGGYATSIYDNSQLLSLVEKCKLEAAQAQSREQKQTVTVPANPGKTDPVRNTQVQPQAVTDPELIAKLDKQLAKDNALMLEFACDPDRLSKLGSDVEVEIPIQKLIIKSMTTSGRIFKDAQVIALFTFLLFGAPFGWYFLLRRIREFRDAIVGK